MSWARRFVTYYVIAFVLVLVGTYSFYWIMPGSFWASYDKILVADASLEHGVLEFRSVRNVRREANLSGVDVLFCDLDRDGEFGHFSGVPWRGDATQPNDGPAPTGPWAYAGRTPAPGTGCYLRAVVTLHLPFGIAKQLEPVYADPFTIEP